MGTAVGLQGPAPAVRAEQHHARGAHRDGQVAHPRIAAQIGAGAAEHRGEARQLGLEQRAGVAFEQRQQARRGLRVRGALVHQDFECTTMA